MGSKILEHDDPGHGNSPDPNKPLRVGGEPRGSHTTRDGDGSLGDGGDEDGGDGDDDSDADVDVDEAGRPLTTSGALDEQKKKKKRKPKKKKGKKKALAQTSPPTVKVSDLFPTGQYPKGEFQEYAQHATAEENLQRTLAAELRMDERLRAQDDEFLSNYRQAAEVHRQVRRWVQDTAKPGTTVAEIAVGIDDGVRALLGNPGLEPGSALKSGMGFPTGVCLNHQVAHYTPNPGQKDVVLQYDDVVTVDFGVHINGWITDSAFTMAFNPTYDNLLAAVKDSTNSGIRAAGVDVRICDVSAVIQEVMESYEVEIRGKTYPVKPIRNLSAHNIAHYRIHGGKSIPFVKNSDQTKMEDGEVFAIETFGSTGRGSIRDDDGIYGYGLDYDAPSNPSLPMTSAKRLLKTIKENFGTIVFNRRYLERLGVERYLAGMNCLVSQGIVEAYAPLADIKGSYSAQFEHTFILQETGKEVISRGDDY